MKNKVNISEKDAKLLFLLCSILILVVVYFFVYQTNMSKKQELDGENKKLKAQVDEYLAMEAQEAEKTEAIGEYKGSIKELFLDIPADVTPEKDIMFIKELEEYATMKVSAATFGVKELLFDSNPEETEDATEAEAEAETEETAATEEEVTEETKLTAADVVVYQSTLSLTYSSTYAGLKKCIDFINNYPERMSIKSINTTYDTSTGNLSGTMEISTYAMDGTDKVYQDPTIAGVKVGTKNIFNTTEIPLDKN